MQRSHSLPIVIAEISANHQGSLSKAREIIRGAAAAGADAIKLQHYTAETITARSAHPDFRISGGTLWDGAQLADLYAEAMTPWEWTDDLADECAQLGIPWFSSPFDYTAVDFLEAYEPPAYKIASFELVDLPLIRYVASKGRPIIMSTGMATVGEIDAAVEAARGSGCTDLTLLWCNSGYPAVPDEMNLRTIPVMRELWGVPVGLSDHTMTSVTAVAAVALGACMVEKHVTLRRSDGGPDSEFSLEPDELASLVRDLRDAAGVLGQPRFGPSAREEASLAFRRSIRADRTIRKGSLIGDGDVRSMRPAGGLPPDCLDDVIGMVAQRDLEVGAPILWSDLGSPASITEDGE